ncbi:class I SAM-dependent methyltransferase [Bryobacter aggregatus]|uniref:class I SAM-dependent methyltransferase n=1 Tax=Bryobacter aggregatus TaxID=360054 RepID=UPI00068C6A7A|nr:methyltransferase domain-containing protein [Bryobacter aggregatus]
MNEKPRAQFTHEEELEHAIREIRERVLARYPSGLWHGLELPDFTPVLEARDQANAKVAAIGRVNPRAGGPINSLIQGGKQLIARALGWFVRDQVDFNYAMIRSLDSVLEGLNGINRTLKTIPPRFDPPIEELRREARELKDIQSNWLAWRREWEDKLARNEVQFLRAVADLQSAYAHRTAVLEQRFEERTASQHKDFEGALERANFSMQQRFWSELEKVRVEYERIIYAEIRSVRQRPAPLLSPSGAGTEASLDIDWVHFANKFRGDAPKIAEHFRSYVTHFEACERVLDIGCGRGEFLSALKEKGVSGTGIDLYAENIEILRAEGLEAIQGDVFEYLDQQGPGSFDGIFCAQVIEHLPPAKVWALVKACATALKPGGVIVFETPNPECLAIFATHFYIDPSHTRPVPPALLCFYLEEAGFGRIDVHRFAPAYEERPELNALPASLKESFFGGLDYYAFARKLS